jgi:hypothetical protein
MDRNNLVVNKYSSLSVPKVSDKEKVLSFLNMHQCLKKNLIHHRHLEKGANKASEFVLRQGI